MCNKGEVFNAKLDQLWHHVWGEGTWDGYTLKSFKCIVSPVLHGITNPQQESLWFFTTLPPGLMILSVADNLAWWETTNSPQATKKGMT